VLVALAIAACGGGLLTCTDRSEVRSEKTESSTLLSLVGSRVEVVGLAYDSKAGSLLDAATLEGIFVGSPVMVQLGESGLMTHTWPEDLLQRRLRIKGTLVRFEPYPPQDPNAHGARLDGEFLCMIHVSDPSHDIDVLSDEQDLGK
jgi:hypothetical protein